MDVVEKGSSSRWWELPADGADAAPQASSKGGLDPLTRAVTRTNAESVALASQRMQALIGWPGRVAACRTPYELFIEQTRFVRMANDQYGRALRNIQAAWAPIVPFAVMWPIATPSSLSALPHSITRTLSAAPGPSAAPRQRDMITFREQASRVVEREAA